jgi:DNA invertase Pin-like site-specific DNA recombinase
LQNENQWQQSFAQETMKIGYARVSKIDDQDTAAQVRELKKAGCKKNL